MASDVFDDGGDALDGHLLHAVHFPRHGGNVRGIFAIDIFVEHRFDFGAALLPLRRRGHLGPVVHGQDVGEFGIGIGLGLIVVGIARLADVIGGRRRLHGGDAEQLEFAITLRRGGGGNRGTIRGGRRRCRRRSLRSHGRDQGEGSTRCEKYVSKFRIESRRSYFLTRWRVT